MKVSRILLCLSLLTLLSSCATVFSGRKQLVNISIPTQGAKLTIDSVYIATGTTFKPLIVKDYQFKQLKFEAEGYKTMYNVLVPDYRSNWSYLTWIPFGLLLIPPYLDMAPNTFLYKDSYTFPAMRKYKDCDSTQKRLFMNDVAFEVNNANNLYKVYRYRDYLSNGDSVYMKKFDSVGMRNTTLDDKLTEVLKKHNYIDTMNTVFVDNVNSLFLNAKITKVAFKDVNSTWGLLANDHVFIETELTTLWIAKSIYGDTVHKSTIVTRSGQFSVINKNIVKAEKLAVDDAIENSMLDFIDTLAANNISNAERLIVTFNEQLKIGKPSKTPTNVGEAMKASVTIKDKEGHGSGFLISNDGYIVTNHHVVKKSGEYTVILNDGTEYKAKVIRSNKSIDLALLKIDGTFEMAYSLPDKQNYKVGDEVWTIGTPQSLQLGQSVAKGIVSGSRKYNGSNYLQTDISVNRGNSGGPILLKNGELVSVVEFKLYGQGTEGISFSIPAYDVMKNLGITY